MSENVLVVIAGPSGVGKSSLCKRMIREGYAVGLITCTTRPPRESEVDGRDYHFLSDEAYDAALKSGEFVEHATVLGNRYGIRRQDIEAALATGQEVAFNIDVQGCETLRKLYPDRLLDIFILPPSLDELRQRLAKRATDSPRVIETRLAEAQQEMARQNEFARILVNDDLDACYQKLLETVQNYRKDTHV